jgi:mRNA-degrading endonuclease toxin of MazEF toxin-antitoxin module
MLQQGRIIWASVPRPDGSPGKPRTAVIVTATAEINDTDPFVVVAITSAFQEPLRDAEVRLPFHPQGGGRIGLKRPTVAVCDWLVELRKSQVLQEVGVFTDDPHDRDCRKDAQLYPLDPESSLNPTGAIESGCPQQ